MTINGVNIGTYYGAKQHRMSVGHCDVKNNSAWISAALLPHFEPGYVGFKQIDMEFIVKGASRDAIIANRSKLLAALMSDAVIVPDNYPRKFRTVMKSHKEEEVSQKRWHKVTVALIGYEYGTEVTVTGTSSVSATNPGTIVSPALLQITPTANKSNVIITGLCRNPRTGADMPVTLGTVKAQKVIVLDGANGLFTEDGSLKPDINIQYPPGVAPGLATVTCSDTSAALSLSILPLYM